MTEQNNTKVNMNHNGTRSYQFQLNIFTWCEFVITNMTYYLNFSLHEGHTLCSVSSQNIVAFTTTTELEDVSGKTWGSHVYVADLNTPWYSHKYVGTVDMTYFSFIRLPENNILTIVTLSIIKLDMISDLQCSRIMFL
jgi:hypothetical protein